jgi:hypothetical protein
VFKTNKTENCAPAMIKEFLNEWPICLGVP